MRDITVLNNSVNISEEEIISNSAHVLSEDHNLSFHLINDPQEFKKLENEWDDLANKANSTIYSTFNWLFGWWKHLGKSRFRSLQIVTIRNNETLICIAPLYMSKTRILGVPVQKRLRLMGDGASKYGNWGFADTYGRSDFLDILCDPDFEDDIPVLLHKIITDIAVSNGVAYLNFEHFNDRSFIKRKLLPYFQQTGIDASLTETDVTPVITIGNSFDEYLSDLSSSSRRKLRKALKAESQKDGFVVKDVLTDSELDAELDILIEMHQQRWNDLGYSGAFFDKRIEPFIKEFLHKALSKKQLWFKIAVDDKGHSASRLAFNFNGKYYDYLTSFDYEAPSSKYRPGIGLLAVLIRDAYENNGKTVELLRGDEAYKFDLTSEVYKNWSWIVRFNAHHNYIKRSASTFATFISVLTFTALKEVTLFQVQKNRHNTFKALFEYPKARYQMLKYKYQQAD